MMEKNGDISRINKSFSVSVERNVSTSLSLDCEVLKKHLTLWRSEIHQSCKSLAKFLVVLKNLRGELKGKETSTRSIVVS